MSTLIILQFLYRSETWSRSHWAKIKVCRGGILFSRFQVGIHFLFPASRSFLVPLACGPLPLLSSKDKVEPFLDHVALNSSVFTPTTNSDFLLPPYCKTLVIALGLPDNPESSPYATVLHHICKVAFAM